MTEQSCECCVYAMELKDGQRTMRVCVNRPGAPGQLAVVRGGDVCHRFCRKREATFRLEPPEAPSDDVRYVPLTKGLFAIVDAADYERVSQYKWCATGSGERAYACRSANGRHLSMHRFLVNPPKGKVVDHIDGNRLNNRMGNLRVCTQRQNLYNSRPKGRSSRYKGVCRDKDKKKWVVYVRHRGKDHYVGRFEVEIEAARAYDRKAFALFGEYAWLNFPEEYGMPPRQRSREQAGS
ncbi:MAG: HNH endonuclease [Sedimentisphaerales bacterium]|nr:HNH endonuclease [Sedimentisphaerales bacterium]